jgi:hypothetical protein
MASIDGIHSPLMAFTLMLSLMKFTLMTTINDVCPLMLHWFALMLINVALISS